MDIYNPYCPHCAVEIDFFDHCDSYDDGDLIVCVARGTCPKCGKRFMWNDVYKLDSFQDVEEVNWTER